MKVLVTGANGFMGSNLVRRLIEKGFEVKGLIQPGTSETFIQDLKIEKFYGDVTEPISIEPVFKDIDIVYHLAAIVSDWGPWELYNRVNVEGTRNMLDCSLKYNIKRFVFIGSIAIHPYTGHLNADENTPVGNNICAYCISKIRCNELVNEYHKNKGLQTTIIRPATFPYGPNDVNNIYKLLEAMEKGKYGYVNGGKAIFCTIYIDDLIEGITLASTSQSAIGNTYIIGDDTKISWKEFSEKVCSELGVKSPKLNLPFHIAYPIAWLMERTYQILRIKKSPLLTRYRILLVSRDLHFSSAKAQRELGFNPRISIDEGIRRTVEWYKNVKRKMQN